MHCRQIVVNDWVFGLDLLITVYKGGCVSFYHTSNIVFNLLEREQAVEVAAVGHRRQRKDRGYL